MVVHVQRQNRCPRSCTPKLPTLLRETPCTEPSALVLLIQPDVHTYPLQCRDLAVQCAPPQHVCAGVEIAHHVLGGRCPVTPRSAVGAAGSSPRPHLAWHQARRSYRSSIERTARTAACRRVCRGGARSLRPLSMQHASSHRDEQQAWCHSHAGGASTAQSRPSFRHAHARYPCHTDRAPRRRGQHPRPAPGAGASAAPVGLLNSQNGHMLYLPPYPRRPVTKFISANAQHPGGSHEPAHGAEHAALRAPLPKTTLMAPIAPGTRRFVKKLKSRRCPPPMKMGSASPRWRAM